MDPIVDILEQNYHPITLREMDSVQFMNRVDRKYVFSAKVLPLLLKEASSFYKVLEIEANRSFNYNTTYYDTDQFHMYNMHMQGKLNRHKLRLRVYEITGTSFLEIKFSSNKGRTIKERIKTMDESGKIVEIEEFLKERFPFPIEALKPALHNKFKRITLVSVESRERITLDYGLHFEDLDDKEIDLPQLSIAELKTDSQVNQSHFVSILRKYRIHSMGFSKYCVGSALLHSDFKQNLLKPQLMLIEKLKNDKIINSYTC